LLIRKDGIPCSRKLKIYEVIVLRMKITFETSNSVIPINYNYYLSSLIYSLVAFVNRELASSIHEKGFGKGFKFFTFSQLFFKNFKVEGKRIKIFEGVGCWYVSSIVEELIECLISSLSKGKNIKIANTSFKISEVRILPSKHFGSRERFRMLSPLALSVPVKRNKKLYHNYLTPYDPEFTRRFSENLVRKYKALYGKTPSGDVKIIPDWDYIKSRKRITKLLDYKGVKIKATIFPFEIAGDPELIKLGYEAGFGEFNSMGFGMVKPVD